MADFSFEEASSQEFGFEEAKPKKNAKSYAGRVLEELPGALEGSARLMASTPGQLIGSIGGAAMQAATDNPDEAKAMQEAIAHGLDPNRLMPDESGRTTNFQNVMDFGMEQVRQGSQVAGQVLGTRGEMLDTPTGNVGAAVGDVVGQLVAMSTVPGAKPLARIVERPFEARKARVEAERQKEQYSREQKTGEFTWDELVKDQEAQVRERQMQDMDTQRRDEGNIPDQNIRSPYSVEAGEKARLEAELNPPVEDRPGSQGELFTEERPYNADELAAKRFVTDESGVGARDKTMPVEKELGATVHTADVIDGARENAGPEGFRPEEPFKGERALDPNRQNQENRRAALLQETLKDRGPSFWESEPKLSQSVNPSRGPRRQRGQIDPDLLTFGTRHLWEAARERYPDVKKAADMLLRKFTGTFREQELADALTNSKSSFSKETVVLMSPDDFLKVAFPREGPMYVGTSKTARDLKSESRRSSVRDGLMTDSGIDKMPELGIRNGKVIGHDGRHRMDVFKEQGLDLVPVRVMADFSWGRERPARYPMDNRLKSELGNETIQMPDSIFFPKDSVIPQTIGRPQVPLSQRGAIGDWSKRIDKDLQGNGLAASMLEARKELTRETRHLSEIVKNGEIDPKTIEDLGLQSKLTDVLIDKTIAILAQSKTGTGRLLKWAQDGRERITREKDVRIEKGIEELLTPWRKSNVSRLDVVGRYKERQALHTDLTEMKDTWHQHVGGEELTRSAFKNERQWEIFKQSHEFIENKFNEWNAKRAAAGLKSFPHITNYFPAIWDGDYRVWIKNANGENAGVRGFTNKIQASFAKKYIQKQHPDYVVEDPVHIKVNEDYHDLSAFEEAMRLNSKDFKAFEELRKTYSRLMRQKGYGAHGLHRENLFGYLGMEEGKTGLKNSEKALEIWLRRGESHVANIEMSKLQSDLHNELPMETQAKIPQAMEYLDDYLGNARGVHIYKALRGVDKAFQNIGKASQFGASAVSRTLSNVSGVGSLFKILTPKFLAANILQPTMILAKLRQLNIRLPESANFAESFAHGYMGTIWPDATQMRAIEWASENQHLNSTVVDMMRMRQEDITTSAGSKFLDSGRLLLSQAEKQFVRIPALLAFEHAFRKDFPNEKERFQVAADHLYYVVNYGHESSPLAYAKTGITGDAARPMKQFGHNYYGQFLEFVQGAKNKQEFSPLGMFLAQQGLLTGLRGLIGFAEITAAITLYNTAFGTDWPTPENWVLKSGMSDWASFGAASSVLGVDISSSVNAPNIPQMLGFFPVSMAYDAGKKVTHLLTRLVKGHATDNDWMNALMATTPNLTHGWIEELFTRPGEPVPHAGVSEMKGTYVRTENEKTVAKLLSLKGLPEARKDAEMRTFKQLVSNMTNQRLEAIEVIADRIMNGKDLDEQLIQLYIEQGGNPSRLGQDIEQRIKARALPFEDQQFLGAMTPQKMRKLEMMKDVLNRSGGGGGQGAIDPTSQDRVDLLNKSIDVKTAARIRAQEANHDPQKIQDRIDGLQKRLDVRGKGALEGSSRQILRRELNDWENAKKLVGPQVKPIGDLPEMGQRERAWRENRERVLNSTPRGNDTDGHNAFQTYTSRQLQGYPDWYRNPMVKGSNIGDLPGAGVPVPNAQDHRRKTRGTM